MEAQVCALIVIEDFFPYSVSIGGFMKQYRTVAFVLFSSLLSALPSGEEAPEQTPGQRLPAEFRAGAPSETAELPGNFSTRGRAVPVPHHYL